MGTDDRGESNENSRRGETLIESRVRANEFFFVPRVNSREI